MKIKFIPLFVAIFISMISLLFSIPFFSSESIPIYLFTGCVFLSNLIICNKVEELF